jgi:transcriptional regulator with XRE-family HTH domain/SOS-response transcriptional repressor LexA
MPDERGSFRRGGGGEGGEDSGTRGGGGRGDAGGEEHGAERRAESAQPAGGEATLGAALRSARVGWGGRGLSLRALAKRVGCAASYLSLIETGQQSGRPSDELLARLERELGLEAGALVERAQWEDAPPAVRREVARLADQRLAAQRLVDALREATRPGSGGRSLDELHARGELHRLLGQVGAAGGTRGAEGAPDGAGDVNPPPAPPSGRGVNPPPAPRAGRRASVSAAQPASGVGGIAGYLPVEVPLINSVAAGYPTEFTDLGYPARVADEYVRVPDVRDPDAFAARVVGDSMEPVYREGDIVVFSPAKALVEAGGAAGLGARGASGGGGVDCFVRLEPDHESTFKRVYFERGAAGEELIRLQPLNPKYPPRVVPREQVAGLYAAVSVTRAV